MYSQSDVDAGEPHDAGRADQHARRPSGDRPESAPPAVPTSSSRYPPPPTARGTRARTGRATARAPAAGTSAENTATKQNTTFDSEPGHHHGIEGAIAEERQDRHSGARVARLDAHEEHQQADPPAEQSRAWPADVHPQASPRSKARLMQTSPAVTASMPGMSSARSAVSSRRLLHVAQQEHDRHDAERHVDEEYAAPVQIFRERAADERTERRADRGKAEHDADGARLARAG